MAIMKKFSFNEVEVLGSDKASKYFICSECNNFMQIKTAAKENRLIKCSKCGKGMEQCIEKTYDEFVKSWEESCQSQN